LNGTATSPFSTFLKGDKNMKNCSGRKRMKRQPMREGAYRVDEATGEIIYMEDQLMEMELGRKLMPNEKVIHKNGDPFDNRMSNLEVVVAS
jgi:hypothetical protein